MPGRVPATRGTSPCRHGREQPRRVTRAVANSGIGTPLPRAQETSRTAEATRRRRKLFPAALPGSQLRSTLPGTRLTWRCGSTPPPPSRPEPDETGGVVRDVKGRDLANDGAIPSGNARRADVQAACPSHPWPSSQPSRGLRQLPGTGEGQARRRRHDPGGRDPQASCADASCSPGRPLPAAGVLRCAAPASGAPAAARCRTVAIGREGRG